MFTHSKKHRTLRQVFAYVLSLALVCSNLSMGQVQASTADSAAAVSSGDSSGAVPTSWEFTTAGGFTETVQGNAATILGLEIDATASGAKFAGRGSDAQVNAGTVVKVPVSGDSVITLKAYDSNYTAGMTFNGEEATISNDTLTYEYAGEAGTVAIAVTQQSYWLSLAVTEAQAEVEVPTSWTFSKESGFTETIQGSTATILGLGIDASASGAKFAGRDSDAQVNAGTVVNVPVAGNSTITLKVYSADYAAGMTFNGEEATVTDDTLTYEYVGEAGTVAIAVTQQSYWKTLSVTASEASEEEDEEVVLDTTKIDVWDFGAEQLDTSIYNNKLNEDIINSWFEAEPGTAGVPLLGFTTEDGELVFNDNGKTNNRLRTINENLCRHDAKSLTDANGVVYAGYFYSNSSATDKVNLQVKAYAGDIITVVVGSNGGDSLINFKNPEGTVEDAQTYLASGAKAQALTFYPAQTGMYTLFSSNEKLVVARIYREHTATAAVTGTVTAPEGLSDYSIVFTNTSNGMETVAAVSNGAYSANLNASYTYDISLKDANGYVITSEATLALAKADTAKTFDITVESVALNTITGSVTGLSEEALAALKLSFTSDAIYIPEVTMNGATYTVQLENGIEYTVVAEGINDYKLTSAEKVSYTADASADVTFAEKTKYAVTIAPEGATLADLANATFTFTNLKEDGYVYTFTGTDGITLRDGTYDVKVRNSGVFVQKLTSNVVVNGAAVTKTIGFDSDITSWDFSDASFKEAAASGEWNGLKFSNGNVNKTYLLSSAGTVSVPVKGACQIKASVCYQYSFYFEADTEASVGVKTGSTGQIDTFTYDYTGEAGFVDITVLGTSYFTKIEVVEVTPYAETVTVGASGCDYTTINDALDAVRSMDRPNGERVTIEIQPGNYEEMLVIDVPNVTLKNASATPSIELKNKGVDIDANAVRITSYYGHGYAYYSMCTYCKWNEEILKVNKENGYLSFENPGTGTTSGSYWNATVVVGASGFEAEGIIFENSFNQYVSAKAADDVIVPLGGAKEPKDAPRASLPEGSTAVQNKAYVERAAALAIMNNCAEISFDNCKFIGRQDTLYGGTGTTAAFYDCAIYGGTDYIFGGMTAVFAKCDLVFNTSEDKNDVGYITAAQTPANTRGYLMWNCNVTSTTPGVDTASEYTSKPGYFGRPWQANTAEALFYYTVIDAADTNWFESHGASLIQPVGWLSTLSGESVLSQEFGTYEMSEHADNQAARAAWSTVMTDDSAVSVEAFLGDWDAFAGKDMTIVVPTDKVDNAPVEEEPEEPEEPEVPVVTTTYVLDTTLDLEAVAQGSKADGDTEKAGTEDYFTMVYGAKSKVDSSNKTFDDGYTATQRFNMGGKTDIGDTTAYAIMFEAANPATVKVWWVSGGDGREMAIFDNAGTVVTKTAETSVKNSLYISELTVDAAGKYFLGSEEGSNYIFKVEVTEEAAASAEPVVNTLDATTDLEAVAQGSKADGDTTVAGSNDYFTLIYSAKTKVDSSNKTFDDGYAASQRINFGGKSEFGDVIKNAVKFETNNAATVKVWWVAGGDGREVALFDNAGAVVTKTAEGSVKNSLYISELTLAEAGTYFLGGEEGSNYIFKIQVTVAGAGGTVKPPRADWSTVDAPVVTDAVAGEKEGTIDVTVSANVGYDGADEVVITMYDAEGNEISSLKSIAEKTEHTRTFTPDASGTYYFSATLSREGEADKVAAEKKSFEFVLPLGTPSVNSATCLGGGKVAISWGAVDEADKYILTAEGTDKSVTTENLSATLEGLTVGQTYTFSVVAVRGDELSEAGTIEWEVVDSVQRTWSFSAFGQGVSLSTNKASGSVYDNNLVVEGAGGKGKLVPASTDGLAFYYTTIDPETENFTLSADITVDEWTYSNGQEGFGLMAADAVGTNGDSSVFWNNSYMASVTKVEYYWDGSAVADGGAKYSMKLGVGAQEKKGVSAENMESIAGGDLTPFSSEMFTLESSAAKAGYEAGTYNIVGNHTNDAATLGTIASNKTFHLTIQRNNTGYFLTYDDGNGTITTKKFYHGDDGDELTQIDKDNIYVGFFASRNAKISVKNVELTTINPADDAPAESRPITYIEPNYSMESAKIANQAAYELVFVGNADGKLKIEDANGAIIVENFDVTANVKAKVPTTLNYGENKFKVTFKPNADYKPSKYEELTHYGSVGFNFTVNYEVNDGKVIYVSPNGSWKATGTKDDPMDIYQAVKKAAPGQYIVLMEVTYNLERTVTVERGISGTADNMIYLIADPEATSRPVLDFNQNCAGMVVAGDYWYMQGFDVTESAPSQKGLQISGDYNVVDQVNAYRNGNTGIQISRYKSTDLYEDWPSNNLILNCTSYLNADPGYEDADGFAAKLTIGDGNVFDGCIAAYNADDGWDLFAKIESGPIGKVVIKNSIAFKNGYDIDANGNEINAGNGNGFKMGGSSISGYHVLENSIAFANKAKGIDSNSCPDIQVINSTSFNNGSFNVAFYTNDAKNTDYSAQGIVSFKDGKMGTEGENLKPKGTQDKSKIENATNYYYPNGNTEGVKAAADWFVSLDTDAAIKGGITRYDSSDLSKNATINMNGYLALTDKAAANAGAVLEGNGTPSPVIELPVISKVTVSENLPADTMTEAVIAATGCNTVAELVTYLRTLITSGNEASAVLSGVTLPNTVVLEVAVQISFDGGLTWELATPENFPVEGVDVTLPYPYGTAGSTHDFVVAHLMTTGAKAGQIEYPAVTKTDDGIKIHVTSASPFAIGFKKIEVPVVPAPSNPKPSNPTPVVPAPAPVAPTPAPATPGQSTSPKTYDDSVWFGEELIPEKLPVAQPAEDAVEAPVVSGAADAVEVPVLVGVDAVDNAVNGEGAMWLIVIAVMGVFAAGLGISAKRYLKKEEK